MSSIAAPARRTLSFAAMRYPQFRWFFLTFFVAMMADNIEHVISYWVMFRQFHSAALGGFAVLSHWLPFLFFSVAAGGLADRIDYRRLIQIGMAGFILASLGWGYFFITDTLTMPAAMALLVLHGCSGVLWQTSSQLLLHGILPPDDLQSGVRLNATARYLGTLVGPALGGALLIGLGPKVGILLNASFYLPLVLWLFVAPAPIRSATQRAVKGLGDIVRTARDIGGNPQLVTMIVLAGAASALIGNSYQAQMPGFAHDLGHGDPGVAYSMLLAADAAGALTAGIALETIAALSVVPATAFFLAAIWCVALGGFALTGSYPLALACLFVAGFCELSFSSIAQTIVQLQAPAEMRGRVIGLYVMAALGCRAFAGVTVGILGTLAGVHTSLATAAGALLILIGWLSLRSRRAVRAT